MTSGFSRSMRRLAVAAGLATLAMSAPVLAGPLRAGAARMDITPDAADFPIVVEREKNFVGVHDSLSARALALDDGHGKVVLLSLEVTTVPGGAAFTQAVAQALGLPADHVLVFASHTHSNPLVFFHGGEPIPAHARAIERTRAGAIAAARAALAALQPARIAYGQGKAYVNINNGEQAGLTRWYDPEGPSDKTLGVVRVETGDGKPLALLVNYASHGEVMFRSVTKDGGYEASGDLPGATMRRLEEAGTAPVVLWSAAAEADQVPLLKSLQPAAGPFPAADAGASGWALVDILSRRLALAVTDTLATMAPGSADARIWAEASAVTCPGQRLRPDHDTGRITATPQPDVTIPLAFLRVNDIDLALVGGDVGSAIGADIRAGLPGRHALVLTQMAGAIGYILPDSAYEKPGHGVFGSPLKPGCAAAALAAAFRKLDGAASR